MAAKSSWHRYLTKLRHCHPAYTSRTRHESRAHLAKAAKLDVERTTRKDDVHVESSKRRRRRGGGRKQPRSGLTDGEEQESSGVLLLLPTPGLHYTSARRRS